MYLENDSILYDMLSSIDRTSDQYSIAYSKSENLINPLVSNVL